MQTAGHQLVPGGGIFRVSRTIVIFAVDLSAWRILS
jgi:hypothetical protein